MPDKKQPHEVYNHNAVLTNQNILKKLAVGQKTLQAQFYLSAHRLKHVNSLLKGLCIKVHECQNENMFH